MPEAADDRTILHAAGNLHLCTFTTWPLRKRGSESKFHVSSDLQRRISGCKIPLGRPGFQQAVCARHTEQQTRVSEGTRSQALPGATVLVGPSGPWAAMPDEDASARRREVLGPDAG